MKRILSIILAAVVSLSMWAGAKKQTVVLDVDIHCQGCITKIEKNIAFEKGVKDLVCNLEEKTVTVTFDPSKTDIPTLLAAFEKINKPAKVHEGALSEAETDEQPETDAQTGASTMQ